MSLHTDTSRKMMSYHWRGGAFGIYECLGSFGLDIGEEEKKVRHTYWSGPLLFFFCVFFSTSYFSLFFKSSLLLQLLFFLINSFAYLLRLE